MKKLIYFMLIYIIGILCFNVFEVEASEISDTDYKSFKEIILAKGKLLSDYTDTEYVALKKHTDGMYFFDAIAIPVNEHIKGSYISNTLFSVYNDGKSDVDYDFEATVEVNNKVTFSTSMSIASTGKSDLEKIKRETSSKVGIELSASNTTSKKEKQAMKIKVEAGSIAIIYLTGTISVSNGVVAVYGLFVRTHYGGYEFVTLESQYPKIEKRSLL